MAIASHDLISVIKATAKKLANGTQYQWGHMGQCNCGNLAQELTDFSSAEIHAFALQSRHGDWNEQVIEYCPTSKFPMDSIIEIMFDAGLSSSDLRHLEKLSNRQVLKRIPRKHLPLRRNKREDVVLYFDAWADLLEDQLAESSTVEEKLILVKS